MTNRQKGGIRPGAINTSNRVDGLKGGAHRSAGATSTSFLPLPVAKKLVCDGRAHVKDCPADRRHLYFIRARIVNRTPHLSARTISHRLRGFTLMLHPCLRLSTVVSTAWQRFRIDPPIKRSTGLSTATMIAICALMQLFFAPRNNNSIRVTTRVTNGLTI